MKFLDGFFLAIIAIAILIGIGWIMNIIALIHTSFSPITGFAIARVIGVFIPPLGGVLGYM